MTSVWAERQAEEFRWLHAAMVSYWTEREQPSNVALVQARLAQFNANSERYAGLMTDEAWSLVEDDLAAGGTA